MCLAFKIYLDLKYSMWPKSILTSDDSRKVDMHFYAMDALVCWAANPVHSGIAA